MIIDVGGLCWRPRICGNITAESVDADLRKNDEENNSRNSLNDNYPIPVYGNSR